MGGRGGIPVRGGYVGEVIGWEGWYTMGTVCVCFLKSRGTGFHRHMDTHHDVITRYIPHTHTPIHMMHKH